MPQLGIRDFTTQSQNTKGENVDILTLQIPKSYTRWELAQKQPPKIFIPLRMDFTVTSTLATAGAFVLTLDYPIAPLNADNPIGTEIYATYGTVPNTFNPATRVNTTPAAAGEYQVVSEAAGTVKVYVPANSTTYWRFYFRPNKGRLSLVRKPATLGVTEVAVSQREFALASLHQMNQLKSYTALRFGREAVFQSNEFLSFRLLMPKQSATQTTDASVTKTVTREALFIPFTNDTTAWDNAVGLIEIPFETF